MVSIVGGGASSLAVASFLMADKYQVTIYERNKAMGRKFLVAGKGGFNLTHSEPIQKMITRYTPKGFLDEALIEFDNSSLRSWLFELDIPTYVGSSRRVFPEKGIKPIEVLKKIKNHILAQGHNIRYDKEWIGWTTNNGLQFADGEEVFSDITIFCLGGGSWKVTGSDGSWSDRFTEKGIKVNPFVAANCGYSAKWKPDFISKSAGKPLKNIGLECKGVRTIGEAMITDFGIEGNAVYALTDQIQSRLSLEGKAILHIDLKPMLTYEEVLLRVEKSTKKITDTLSKDLKLERIKIQLLKSVLSREEFLDSTRLSKAVKGLPIELIEAEKLDKAISTTGGIGITEVDKNYQLKTMPGNYAIGEMIDWNAPTGGYLLQSCFSMGYYLAAHLNRLD